MKRNTVLSLLALACGCGVLFGQAAPAQYPAAAPVVPNFQQPIRMGFINLERAISEVQEGKVLFGLLQNFIEQAGRR